MQGNLKSGEMLYLYLDQMEIHTITMLIEKPLIQKAYSFVKRDEKIGV